MSMASWEARAKRVHERLREHGVPTQFEVTDTHDGAQHQHQFKFKLGPIAEIVLAELIADVLESEGEDEKNMVASLRLSRPEGWEA